MRLEGCAPPKPTELPAVTRAPSFWSLRLAFLLPAFALAWFIQEAWRIARLVLLACAAVTYLVLKSRQDTALDDTKRIVAERWLVLD